MRHAGDRSTLQHAVVHTPQFAAAFRDQEITVRQEREAPGMRKAADQRPDVNGVVFGLKCPIVAAGPVFSAKRRAPRRGDGEADDDGSR
jgi:hypothetical protein